MLGKLGRALLPYVLGLPRGEWAFEIQGMLAAMRREYPLMSAPELTSLIAGVVRRRCGERGRLYFLTPEEFRRLKNGRGRPAQGRA